MAAMAVAVEVFTAVVHTAAAFTAVMVVEASTAAGIPTAATAAGCMEVTAEVEE